MKKLTLWNDPIGHIKFWWEMKMACMRVCGNWFGVLVYPNGKVEFRDETMIDILDRCPVHKVGKND